MGDSIMKCPECQFENPEGSKFCGGCGERFDLTCSECGANNPTENKFCNECGSDLIPVKEVSDQVTETISPPVSPSKETLGTDAHSTAGERKHVTVLFSDLTGYTVMSERLDPEESKEITTHLFDKISKIISKYEGFIEKYAGDAVMALFGATETHEDDPVRAIHAAKEIHQLVNSLSPQYEERIEHPLSMHSGVNTGLVVTGDVNLEKGVHGVAGDTINLASRLSSLAKADEIFVGPDTYRRAEGHYSFERLEPQTIKGKEKPAHIYKVLEQKEQPITVHRLSGLRAALIGRKAEFSELEDAVKKLQQGRGKIFSICGDAGTGKSRLVEDFKANLDLEKIQWIEGRAYSYAQNIPYFPLIDMLNRVFQIEDADPPDIVKQKLEKGITDLVESRDKVTPYIGSLYSINYEELETASPELWKLQLREGAKRIISALSQRATTIFLLEDLHWADPSFVELLRHSLLEVKQPAIVLCVYRPTFSLFTAHQARSIGKLYKEIRLKDLSASEAQDMLESLLKTDSLPSELRHFVQDKAEGNPFYLEELVNSLIETETIRIDNGNWSLTRPIMDAEISSTIHGVISGRIDRLENETKRILQEASVIGRAFFYDILKQITQIKNQCDECISNLERLDLIRARTLQPDIEYIFKHALAQEVVYNGLLKKERQEIHERIALVMESIFKNRLSEFYETLAYHFRQGQSHLKAVQYLVKSGEKSLARYAVEEAHQYFQEGFDILTAKTEKSKEEKAVIINIINNWGFVYYYIGEYAKFVDLMQNHKEMAESLDNPASLGMFYAWFGIALLMFGKTKKAYKYLIKGLKLGEKTGDQKVIGYACTWLPWTCAELGYFADGIRYGERAQKIAEFYPADLYIYFKSLAGVCYVNWMKGNAQKALEGAELLLTHGEHTANSRSRVMGHWIRGFAYISLVCKSNFSHCIFIWQ
jgi:class 3 adenylate cyclase